MMKSIFLILFFYMVDSFLIEKSAAFNESQMSQSINEQDQDYQRILEVFEEYVAKAIATGDKNRVKKVQRYIVSKISSDKMMKKLEPSYMFNDILSFYQKNRYHEDIVILYSDLERLFSYVKIPLIDMKKKRYLLGLPIAYILMNYYVSEELLTENLKKIISSDIFFLRQPWSTPEEYRYINYNRARGYRLLTDYSRSRTVLNSIKLEKKNYVRDCFYHRFFFRLLLDMKDFSEAEKRLDAFFKNTKGSKGECVNSLYFIKALTHFEKSEDKKALESLKELENRGGKTYARIGYLRIFRKMGEIKSALTYAQQVVSIKDETNPAQTIHSLYRYLAVFVTSVVAKNEELFKVSQQKLDSILKLRVENSRFKDLVVSWTMLGESILFNKGIDRKRFKRHLANAEANLGKSHLELVELKKLTKKILGEEFI